MRIVASVLALAVALTIVGKLSAADDKACPATKPQHHAMGLPWDILKGLDLTDEQKAKVKELRKGCEPKFKEAVDNVLTADQKEARDDAIKAAKGAGKKGPEVFKAARAAVKLTDEQETKLKEVMQPLHKEVHEKLMAILTSEQKEQLKQTCPATKPQHHAMGLPWDILKGLNLTDDQKAKVKDLHKEVHEKLMAILTPEQREQLKQKCPATKPQHHAMGLPWDVLKGLNLTDDQKAKVKELRKEYGPKFKAAADSVLTADQKEAREDAVKAAKAEGKKGPEVGKAAMEAVKLTDDQKAKMKEVMKPLHKEVHEKLMAILTPEQQEQLK
jgi:Spy/CpxP family protein refolding chaperone